MQSDLFAGLSGRMFPASSRPKTTLSAVSWAGLSGQMMPSFRASLRRAENQTPTGGGGTLDDGPSSMTMAPRPESSSSGPKGMSSDGLTRVWLPGLGHGSHGGFSTLNISDSPNDAVACSLSQVLEGGGDPAAVLFEPRGLHGDFAPGGEAREIVAALTANGVGTCGADDNQGQAGHLIASTGRLSHCLNAGGMGRQDFETETLIAHTLRGEGFDASEDGTGRGTPLVPVYAIQERAVSENPDAGPQGAGFREDVAYTLEARHHVQAIAFPANLSSTQCASTEDVSPALGAKNPTAVAFALRGREGGAQGEVSGDVSGPLRAANGGSSRDYIAFAENQRNELRALERAGSLSSIRRGDAKNETLIAFNSKDHGADAGGISPTLRAGGHSSSHANAGVPPAVAGAGSVRRLTPRECERLQGFPDDYTAVSWRGKNAEVCPDGPRYKALGNSMAVPVMRWIGARIQQHELERRDG